MMMATPAPSAPVISHLRPRITQVSPSLRALVAIIDGSEPAPSSGSVIMKAERIWPAASGRSQRSCWAGVITFWKRCMLPSSGAMQFMATGPSIE